MSSEEPTISNKLLTFVGIIGAILIFALVMFVAYLPTLPDPANQKTWDDRQAAADAARAAGAAKLEGYEVINQEAGIVRIPIEDAKALTLNAYN